MGTRALASASGTGDDTAKVGAAVGPTGSALGVDFSGAMVDESRRRWEASGLRSPSPPSATRKLDLPSAHFDACARDRVSSTSLSRCTPSLVSWHQPARRACVVLTDPGCKFHIPHAPPTLAVPVKYHDLAQRQAKKTQDLPPVLGTFRELASSSRDLHRARQLLLDLDAEKLGNLDAGSSPRVQTGQLTGVEVASRR
ncbi:MAG: hypothetical protein IPI35_21045 [Deltaproteobacteria bacterium]|nr:hypothetical protein [Deltaproteobacteria bacterium]